MTINLELSKPVLGTTDWILNYKFKFNEGLFTMYFFPITGQLEDFYVTVTYEYQEILDIIQYAAFLVSDFEPISVRVKGYKTWLKPKAQYYASS